MVSQSASAAALHSLAGAAAFPSPPEARHHHHITPPQRNDALKLRDLRCWLAEGGLPE